MCDGSQGCSTSDKPRLKKSPLIQGALLKLGAAELGSEAEGGLHQTTELIEALILGG